MRGQPTALSTPGTLTLPSTVSVPLQCHTLEPPPKTSPDQCKPYAIPAGRYKVELLFSEHFQTITPHVLNVPGFTAIEIHWGNFPRDTHGCLLVGKTDGVNFVGQSREEFDALMVVLTPAQDDLWIEYVDAPPLAS